MRITGTSGHSIRLLPDGSWRTSWTLDMEFAGSPLRHETGRSCTTTDRAQARRFAKKHSLHFPEVSL